MSGLGRGLVLLLILGLALWTPTQVGGQGAPEVCAFIERELDVSPALKEVLCRDYRSGIERGHLQPLAALRLLSEVDDRLTEETRKAAERLLLTVGATVSPLKGDLPAELLIRRAFELFSRAESPPEALSAAAREAELLRGALERVARVYRGLGIALDPEVSRKVIRTGFGEVELTVGRVDTVITAAAIALDRFERRLDRRLDDFAGMKAEVMKELSAPSFPGAVPVPEPLTRYVGTQTTGRDWAPIVVLMAQARGRAPSP